MLLLFIYYNKKSECYCNLIFMGVNDRSWAFKKYHDLTASFMTTEMYDDLSLILHYGISLIS